MRSLGAVIRTSISALWGIVLIILCGFRWDILPNTMEWYQIVAKLATITFVINFVLILFKHKSVTCFEMLFLILNQFFAFGRVYLLAFNKKEYIFWDLMVHYTNIEKWKAGCLALLFIHFFIFGLLLYSPQKNKLIKKNKISDKWTSKQLYYGGLLFFILTEPITIYVALKNISAIVGQGSYRSASVLGVIGCLSYVSTAGIILMIASKYLKKKSSLCLLICYNLFSLVLSAFTADRRYVVTGVLITILEYLYVYRIKLKIGNVILLSAISLIVLAFINAVRAIRSASVTNINSVIEYMFEHGFNVMEVFYSALAEFGITFFTYLEVVVYYPNVVPFKYGMTYVGGIVGLIPGIGKLIPGITNFISVPGPIENIVNYSVGGSLGEEIYGNFGSLSIIMFLVAGYIVAYIMRKNVTNSHEGYSIGKYYILFYFFINLVRASFNEMFRSCVWTFLLVYLCMVVIKEFVKSEKTINENNVCDSD